MLTERDKYDIIIETNKIKGTSWLQRTLVPLCFLEENLMVRKKKFRLSTTQIILLGLLETILARSMLLALQIRSAIGKAVRYLDTLLTATTVTCVTALVTLPTARGTSANRDREYGEAWKTKG